MIHNNYYINLKKNVTIDNGATFIEIVLVAEAVGEMQIFKLYYNIQV